MKRVRFYVSKEACKDDYRPVKWPIKHPYWCVGETDTCFILVAYVESIEELIELWPEAKIDLIVRTSKVKFTNRRPKPNWYKEDENSNSKEDNGLEP